MKIGFAIPGRIETVSGGYAYDRALLELLPRTDWRPIRLELPSEFPNPSAQAVRDTRALLSAHAGPLLIDGLAYGAFPSWLSAEIGPRAVVLVHHPLCLEAGLSRAEVERLEASEHAAISAARGVIVTGRETVEVVQNMFGVDPARIVLAEPGVPLAERAPLVGDPPRILAVGAIIRRKRHSLLVEALSHLADLDWRLDIVGPLLSDPDESLRLRQVISNSGVGDRITVTGSIGQEALVDAYWRADLFVSTSSYEGYGMAVQEAIAHGLPVVATPGGALRDTASVGLLLDSETPEGIARALRPLLEDRRKRLELGDASWLRASALPRWEDTAATVAAALGRFLT